MAKPSRIIDVHQHVFWHGRDDAALVANLDAHGIDRAVVLNWDVTPLERAEPYEGAFNATHVCPGRHHPGLPLADVVRAARRYPSAPTTPIGADAGRVESVSAPVVSGGGGTSPQKLPRVFRL